MTSSPTEVPLDFEPAPFFVLRTPLLAHDELAAWTSGVRAPTVAHDDAAQLAAALCHDRQLLRERLRAIVERPEVREAIFVASPTLESSIAAWLADGTSSRGEKVERSLVRYLLRMASRPTPFGLFAGCSVGTLGADTELTLEARAHYRRHARIDAGALSSVVEALGRDPAVRRTVRYRPNGTLHRVAGRARFVESRTIDGTRTYVLSTAELTPPVEIALRRCADGATFDELADALVAELAEDDVSRADADAFVGELIDAQLVLSELDLPVTGADPLSTLVDELGAAPATAAVAELLAGARRELAALSAAPLGVAPARYRAIAERMARLPAPIDVARLFQVDMMKASPQATLGVDAVGEIARAVEILRRLSRRPVNDALKRFREAFVARYEGREVPLVEALDEDMGIGFERSPDPTAEASPLLQGLPFAPPSSVAPPSFDARHRHLLAKLDHALRSGAREIVLDDPDVEAMAGDADDALARLPDSFAAVASIAAPSPQALVDGDFRVHVSSVDGPSGANLLGRFCYADAALEQHVRDYLRREEQGQQPRLLAEIVHLPEGRIGNVIQRPLLRSWEIVFLGRSGAPRDRQLPLDDLLVSVDGDRVVLRSRRLGREIVPCLTTAHHYATPRNLSAYRFLCALRGQGTRSLHFSWGALDGAPFLPRVRVGRVVLSVARWRLGRDRLAPLATDDGDARFAAAQALRRSVGLPRWIGLAEDDQVLPIDLDNVLAVDTFAQLVKDRPSVIVNELFDADASCARGPEGRFVQELVVPFTTRRNRATPSTSKPQAPPIAAQVRRFVPGSEWLYAKLYTGSGAIDDVLRDVIAPIVAAETRAFERWFFVRYADPDWHVRVRFFGDPQRLRGELLPRLLAAADDATRRGAIWRVQLDTYERECERYGGERGVALSEQLFCDDSDTVLGLLGLLRGDGHGDTRWRLALRGLDQLLDDVGLSLDEKHALAASCRAGLAPEFGDRELLQRHIGERFRRERLSLEALLDRSLDGNSALAPALALFDARSRRVRPIVTALRAAIGEGQVSASLPELAAAWLHMHANRILRGAARAHELVLYDFLERLYAGQRARRR